MDTEDFGDVFTFLIPYFVFYVDIVSELVILNILTQCQNVLLNMEGIIKMKRNLGSKLALYPTPVAIVGAMNNDKPTWTLVAHVGIIGHDRVLVSLMDTHYINQFIKKNKKLSLNLVDENLLPKADYIGTVSGAKQDKSHLFEYELAQNGSPIIQDSPLVLECTVVDIYSTKSFESFICTIDGTYVEEKHLNQNKIDYNTLKPVLFEFPNYEYLKTGDILGKCRTLGNTVNQGE